MDKKGILKTAITVCYKSNILMSLLNNFSLEILPFFAFLLTGRFPSFLEELFSTTTAIEEEPRRRELNSRLPRPNHCLSQVALMIIGSTGLYYRDLDMKAFQSQLKILFLFMK